MVNPTSFFITFCFPVCLLLRIDGPFKCFEERIGKLFNQYFFIRSIYSKTFHHLRAYLASESYLHLYGFLKVPACHNCTKLPLYYLSKCPIWLLAVLFNCYKTPRHSGVHPTLRVAVHCIRYQTSRHSEVYTYFKVLLYSLNYSYIETRGYR